MATLAKLVLILMAAGMAAVLTLRVRRGELSYSIPGAVAGALVVLLAFALMPAFGYIPVGHRGVVVGPNGVVMVDTDGDKVPDRGRVLGEGFYFLPPFLYNVEVLSVRTEAYKATGLEAASSDLQDVKAEVVINYRILPANAGKVYQELGADWQAKVFNPAVIEALKASTALFDAEDLIQQRPRVSAEIRRVLEHRGALFGFEVQAVSLTQFNFSEEFNKAIEAKARATQDAETARRIVLKVKAEQEAKILQYQAEATRRKLELEAQALGQKAQLQYITPQLIQLRYAEAALEMAKAFNKGNGWDGRLPAWMTGGGLSTLLQITPPTAADGGR